MGGVVKVKVKVLLMGLAMISVSLCLGGKGVGAAVHHIAGGERGWDPFTDLASWSSGRTFRVGDKIWFTHSAGQGEIAELETKEEYTSCNVSNPIRMYTDSTDGVSLDGEGIRYFASSNSAKCKTGLKLHVDVLPQETNDAPINLTSSEGSAASALAAGPTPSGSAHLSASFAFFVAAFWVCHMGI